MDSPPLLVYRVGHWLHRAGLRPVAFAVSWVNRLLFATWLPSSSEIGKGVQVGYWGLGIVVHSNTRIGDDCTIAQNVTIGRLADHPQVPVLGQRVYVGAGACILGPVEIGDDAIVGANAVVLHSVPARSIVAGVPAKILRTRTDEELRSQARA